MTDHPQPAPSPVDDGPDLASEGTPRPPSTSRSPSLVRMLLLVAAVALVAMAAMSVGGGTSPGEGGAEPGTETAGGSDQVAPQTQDGQDAPGGAAAGQTAPSVNGDDLPELHAERFAERLPDDPRALGDVDAPVVMIEWGDFLCGYCARFARETEPELIRRYVDTGILRIEWRDLPLQGDAAWIAAVGGRAAADQGAFWAYHERLYADAPADRQVQLTRDGMRELANDLGLDAERFDATFDDAEVVAHVGTEHEQAQRLGIGGTPAFLIDDQPVMGAQSLETFVRVIESAAATRGVELP
jgi:protein-disulfide isomerase